MKNGNQYYLINIDGTLINRVNSNPIKEMVKIPSDKGVLNADFRTLNENNDIIYYTKDNAIFNIDENDTFSSKLVNVPDKVSNKPKRKYIIINFTPNEKTPETTL